MLTSVVRGRNHRKETGSKVQQGVRKRKRVFSRISANLFCSSPNKLAYKSWRLPRGGFSPLIVPPASLSAKKKEKRKKKVADWPRNPAEFNAVKRIQISEENRSDPDGALFFFFFFPWPFLWTPHFQYP